MTMFYIRFLTFFVIRLLYGHLRGFLFQANDVGVTCSVELINFGRAEISRHGEKAKCVFLCNQVAPSDDLD